MNALHFMHALKHAKLTTLAAGIQLVVSKCCQTNIDLAGSLLLVTFSKPMSTTQLSVAPWLLGSDSRGIASITLLFPFANLYLLHYLSLRHRSMKIFTRGNAHQTPKKFHVIGEKQKCS